MTDRAISPLRQRMIEDMTIRKFAPKTQHDYVQKHFAVFLGRLPDTARFEDVRRYQLHLATSGAVAAFGRRPRSKPQRRDRPASETLNRPGHQRGYSLILSALEGSESGIVMPNSFARFKLTESSHIADTQSVHVRMTQGRPHTALSTVSS